MVMETAMVPVYGPHPDDLDATLDDYDEHMREADLRQCGRQTDDARGQIDVRESRTM